MTTMANEQKERARKWVTFTRRTNYPKLGYLIYCCQNNHIPTRIVTSSAHAPILEVPPSHEEKAWGLLPLVIDNMPDDDPGFEQYANVKPDFTE